ncbi:MAG: helix-turn-helix domain-containing protein [Thermomicrobiales bacterium]
MSTSKSTEVRHQIGGLIKQRRMADGTSLQDLAQAVAISASHLGRLERGLVSPSYVLVDRLSRHLGIELIDVQDYDRRARLINTALMKALEQGGVNHADQTNILGLTLEGRESLLNLIASSPPVSS